jgi:hypothetical protein
MLEGPALKGSLSDQSDSLYVQYISSVQGPKYLFEDTDSLRTEDLTLSNYLYENKNSFSTGDPENSGLSRIQLCQSAMHRLVR